MTKTKDKKRFRLALAAFVAYENGDTLGMQVTLKELWDDCSGLAEYTGSLLGVPTILFDHFDGNTEAVEAAKEIIALLAVSETNTEAN